MVYTRSRFAPLACTHCQHLVDHPRWRKIAHLRYAPLCWPCYSRSVLLVTLARQLNRKLVQW
jgi:hypothetical protein